MKFRKKPVIIEAIQATERTTIHTLEGDMTANEGDWIITGIKGERYPCKPDIFEATYESIDTISSSGKRTVSRRQLDRWASYPFFPGAEHITRDDRLKFIGRILSELGISIDKPKGEGGKDE